MEQKDEQLHDVRGLVDCQRLTDFGQLHLFAVEALEAFQELEGL